MAEEYSEPIKFRSDVRVALVDMMGNDEAVAKAAKVSLGVLEVSSKDVERLINYLMKNRHGTPFEHVVFKFYLEVPIRVARELQRHRIASYNEWSTRYSEVLPHFFIPDRNRNLKQVGKPGNYDFVPAPELYDYVQQCMKESYAES